MALVLDHGVPANLGGLAVSVICLNAMRYLEHALTLRNLLPTPERAAHGHSSLGGFVPAVACQDIPSRGTKRHFAALVSILFTVA